MNIFYLHHDPRRCARYHLDRHCVKMILESAQLLCTALWLCGPIDPPPPLKKTHHNHPSAIWARAGKANWLWLQSLALALCYEYTFRYDRQHKLETAIKNLATPNVPDIPFTPPPQAMPDVYKHADTITAYRQYYILGKSHLHFNKSGPAWKRRKMPAFIRRALYSDQKW